MTEAQWMTIYRETVRPLYGYLARRNGNIRELSEDIVQETYLRALQSWGRKGAPALPLAWLKRVALNILIDHARRFKGARRVDGDPEAAAGRGPREDPAKALDVCLAVAALGGRKARVLEAFYFDGKSVRQIAAEMAISERAVEGLLRRARRSLKTRLPEFHDNGGSHERSHE